MNTLPHVCACNAMRTVVMCGLAYCTMSRCLFWRLCAPLYTHGMLAQTVCCVNARMHACVCVHPLFMNSHVLAYATVRTCPSFAYFVLVFAMLGVMVHCQARRRLVWLLPLTSAAAVSLGVAGGEVGLSLAAIIGSVVVGSIVTTMAAVGAHAMYSHRRAVVTSTTVFPVLVMRAAYVVCDVVFASTNVCSMRRYSIANVAPECTAC